MRTAEQVSCMESDRPVIVHALINVDGPVLLRLSQALTPSQAQEYQAALVAD